MHCTHLQMDSDMAMTHLRWAISITAPQLSPARHIVHGMFKDACPTHSSTNAECQCM